ncbi:MAG: MBL fold metallo-hydrolase [Shinella sp.]|nr:MBL fold metallo-hydrolase [Shinella sp.]
MDVSLGQTAFDGPLSQRLSAVAQQGPVLYWLGQAGFVLDIAGRRIVIDPYLSDSLAEKYRGTPRPHIRMMAPPIAPGELQSVDLVLCTHSHTDHMDPGTLPRLLKANPAARLIAPRAVRMQALERSGIDESRLLSINAGEALELFPELKITATQAAHEKLDTDQAGNHKFLGYLLSSPFGRIWHSGDCIPFDGLVGEVAALKPDLALLPVNGRRPELTENGIAGNFFLEEAVDIARSIGAKAMIAHHYGLFDFNTADPEAIDSVARNSAAPCVARAREAIAFELVTF